MKEQKEKKWMQYANVLVEKVGEALDELHEDEDFDPTEFFHALMNVVPTFVYKEMSDDEDLDILEVNHIANRLCMQFSNVEK